MSPQSANSRAGLLQHLSKKGQFRKSWKQRYFILKGLYHPHTSSITCIDGMIQLYARGPASAKESAGQNLREVIDLTGASVALSTEVPTRLAISLPKNKSLDLEASSEEDGCDRLRLSVLQEVQLALQNTH